MDPIDGTRSYLAGRPDWVISVALVADGRPILAAVFAPVSDELFIAAAGGGATRNGVPIRVSAGARLDGSNVVGPRRLVQALATLALAGCAWLLYKLAALWFGRAAGVLAALIVLTRVLRHAVNSQMSLNTPVGVEKINGQEIRSLADVSHAFSGNQGRFHTIELEGDGGIEAPPACVTASR